METTKKVETKKSTSRKRVSEAEVIEVTTTTTQLQDETVNEQPIVIESSPEAEEQLQKQAQEIVSQKSPQEMLNDWLNDPGTKKMLAEFAEELRQRFHHTNAGWFELIHVTKFTRFKTLNQALEVLNYLKLSNLMVAEMRGKKEVYKIVMTDEAKLRVLESQLKQLDAKRKLLLEDIADTERRIELSTTTTTQKESL